MTEQQEIQCYGMTVAAMKDAVENPTFGPVVSPPWMIAMSILSDCQELLTHPDAANIEMTRQWVNRVKWIIREYCALDAPQRQLIQACIDVADPASEGVVTPEYVQAVEKIAGWKHEAG